MPSERAMKLAHGSVPLAELFDAERLAGMEAAAEIAAMSSGLAPDVERAIRAAIAKEKEAKG